MTKGHTTWQFVEVAARPFITLAVDSRSADDPTAAVLTAIAQQRVTGAIVRVNVRLRVEQDLLEKDVREALGEADFVAGLNRQVDQAARD